ncbi:MAG: replicative DNA helicase [Spirochaetaceae bacterium]|jgi:replicative DNA helicase|nr:replicative DNA helicase [Spirochaetaceae bacterium]
MPPLKDKVPPHNNEAEQAVLGAILLDNDAIDTALQYIRPDDFYSTPNRRVFKAILNLHDQGRQKADIITVVAELRQMAELDATGGAAYVASLTNVVPSSANIDYYARLVQDCSLRRALLRVSAEVNTRSFDESVESRIILEETQQQILELGESRQAYSYKSTRELIPDAVDIIEKRYHAKEAWIGIPSGFGDLDTVTAGFQNSELIIIGARPSMGKTAIGLTMAAYITIEKKIPAAFFSLEMSDMALCLRLISSESLIESQKIRTGLLSGKDFGKLMAAAARIHEAPLYIVDTPGLKLLDLRSQARRLKAQQGVEIIFIDYLTLISSDNYQIPRHEQIAEISRSLKSLARELDIPVVALSQLRRDAEGKRPNLSDIRESGSIEQDADLVMFLHRERETDVKSGKGKEGTSNKTELIIAKQRNGPVGIVDIVFLPQYAKFVSFDRVHQ